MDPNICLEKLRKLSKEVHASTDYNDQCDVELAQGFDDLDGWLSKQGFLPDAWDPGCPVSLLRKEVSAGKSYVSVHWQHPGYGSYMHVFWRKGEPNPLIDVCFAEGDRGINEARVIAALLKAAAATAEGWVAKPPWPT